MDRHAFVTGLGAVLAAPLRAQAQQRRNHSSATWGTAHPGPIPLELPVGVTAGLRKPSSPKFSSALALERRLLHHRSSSGSPIGGR